MAPKSASVGVYGTPAFLARVMALPAFNDALVLATQVYDTTKRNEVMGAALRAAEASMAVAATGALPLAAPLLERVGGWQRVDEWACRGLDRVEEAAPIIKKPTKEIVNTTRQRVLGAVAGDQVIVPDTLAEAIIARANRVVEAVTESVGVRAATEAVERALDTTHGLLDTYLPPGHGGDHLYPDEAGVGVTGRSLLLVRKTGHRMYRATVRTVRPDLTSDPDALITPQMLVEFGQAKLVGLYKELRREARPGEEVGVAMTLARRSIRVTIDVFTQVNAMLRDLSFRKVTETVAANFPPDTKILVARLRNLYTDLLTRLTPVIQTAVDSLRSAYSDLLTRLTPVIQTVVDSLRSAYSDLLTRLSPVIQTSVDSLRNAYTDLLTRLSPVIQTSVDSLRNAYTDLLTRLSPVIQTSIDSLRSAYTDLLARLTPWTQASAEWLRTVSNDSMDRLSPVVQGAVERLTIVYLDALGRLPPEARAPIQRLVSASSDALTSIPPAIQASFIRARSIYAALISRFTTLAQEALKILREIATEPASRLPQLLQSIRAAAAGGFVRVIETSVDTFRRSLSAERATEAGAVILDYVNYVAEEARLWTKVVIVLLQVTPSIALRISQTTRIFAAEWLRSTVTSLEQGGRPGPTLYKKGFVAVKVSMMAPGDAARRLGDQDYIRGKVE
ncbi:uncharacterized protein [Procambarus clarkii]|uniref:uncharacterized protein n=1 Tax=Procambarus clarkii TaxID=6728 RepID=UPI003743650C